VLCYIRSFSESAIGVPHCCLAAASGLNSGGRGSGLKKFDFPGKFMKNFDVLGNLKKV